MIVLVVFWVITSAFCADKYLDEWNNEDLWVLNSFSKESVYPTGWSKLGKSQFDAPAAMAFERWSAKVDEGDSPEQMKHVVPMLYLCPFPSVQ